jgi:tRNA1(Val) A37 N6-methylase TrmN6
MTEVAEAAPQPLGELTEDGLLGGRVVLRQPRAGGLRAGLDAVLLAAAIPAKPGERVLEAGCGSGAAFLCLAARVPDLSIVAVERDAGLAALARENAAANGLAGRVEVIEGDVADPALRRALPRCDHAFANPPYWPGGTAPPEARRRGSTHTEDGPGLAEWAACLAATLAARGATATLVLPAARFDSGVAALRAAGCGGLALLPLWPRAGESAKRVLLQGRRGGRGPARVLPGLVLHGEKGFTPEAEALLREGAPLSI